ncbi:MAG: cytochrome C assembly family protein, partial [Janthinobacterium lividum]
MLIVLYALTVFIYAALSFAAWHMRRRPLPVSAVGARRGGATAAVGGVGGSLEKGLLLVALAAHGLLLHMTIFRADSMVFGFAFALSAMFWLGGVIYWIESFFFPIEGLGLLVLPLACVALIFPLIFGGVPVLSYAAAPMFKIHFVIANLAYGLLALAALHAILMLLVERRLHPVLRGNTMPGTVPGMAPIPGPDKGWLAIWLDSLPPLLTLEKLLFRMIGASFVLLTLTLISGVLFSEQLLGEAARFDHKTVFAVLSWLMFGG